MQPLDLTVLSEQTAGDRGLEREVLRLFVEEAPNDLARLGSTAEDRRMAAHRLVGSARAIGAGEVARLAAEIEAGGGDLAALEAAIAEARSFIVRHLASDT